MNQEPPQPRAPLQTFLTSLVLGSNVTGQNPAAVAHPSPPTEGIPIDETLGTLLISHVGPSRNVGELMPDVTDLWPLGKGS